jgi:uncharacterized C2H2 Zn-finger protein
VSEAMPAFIISISGTIAMPIQRSFDAANQDRAGKRFRKEAYGAYLQCPGTDILFRERRNKNERHVIAANAHMHQQVQAAHPRHLHIRNDTRNVVRAGRLQEIFGRHKCTYGVSVRAEEIIGCCANGCIIVNDGNNRKR